MHDDLISVIVPAHNVERYIDKCLASLANQTHKNLEIIIIDDNSPDDSGVIADKWAQSDSRFTVVHNKKNMGHSTVRNVGLDLAKGRYIGFADPDDFVHPEMFERLLELIRDNEADISLCLEQAFNDGETEPDFSEKKDIEIRLENHDDYIKHFMDSFTGPIGWSWNKLYKAELFNNIRYREYKLEDIILNAEISAKVKKAVWTNERLYAYRVRTDSETAAGKKDISLPAAESFWKTYEMLFYNGKAFSEKYLVFVLGKLANLYANCRKNFGSESSLAIHEVYCQKYDENIKGITNISTKDSFKLFLARYLGPVYSFIAK